MQYSAFFDCMLPWTSSYTIKVASYKLFLNITDKTKIISKGVKYKDDLSESLCDECLPQKYYKYAKGTLPINTIAHKIHNHINKVKFVDFLKREAYNKPIKESLLNNFMKKKNELRKEHLFEREDKLYEDIADVFIELIKDAAQVYENSPRNNKRNISQDQNKLKPKSNDGIALKTQILEAANSNTSTIKSVGASISFNNNEDSDKYNVTRPTIKKRHAEKIEEIVSNIEALIEPLIYDSASDMEEESFKSNYSRFRKLNGDLCGYASMYPFIMSLQKLPEFFLEKTDFCICEESSPRLLNYALFLLAIRKEITALDEE